jgi:hypothetical protein
LLWSVRIYSATITKLFVRLQKKAELIGCLESHKF